VRVEGARARERPHVRRRGFEQVGRAPGLASEPLGGGALVPQRGAAWVEARGACEHPERRRELPRIHEHHPEPMERVGVVDRAGGVARQPSGRVRHPPLEHAGVEVEHPRGHGGRLLFELVEGQLDPRERPMEVFVGERLRRLSEIVFERARRSGRPRRGLHRDAVDVGGEPHRTRLLHREPGPPTAPSSVPPRVRVQGSGVVPRARCLAASALRRSAAPR
jgi:hypothetical protein